MTEKDKWPEELETTENERRDRWTDDELPGETEDRAAGDDFEQDDDDRAEDRGQAAGAKNGKQGGGMAWKVATIALAAALIVLVAVNPPFGSDGSKAVATVNGDKISKDELYDKLVESNGRQTLDNLITEKLIDQEMARQGLTVTEADLDKEIEQIKANFPSEQDYELALAQSGMTEDDLREQMPLQVKIRKLLEPRTDVTDQEVSEYYNENKDQFATPEQVRASHILVETEEEAEAIKKELDGGADFAALAKEKSIDPGSKDNGGDLNFFPRGRMHQEFEDAAFALQPGEVSGIVKSPSGYHIIKVTDRKAATNPTLAEKKEEIRALLVEQEIQSLAPSWLQELRANAKITNTLETEAAPAQ